MFPGGMEVGTRRSKRSTRVIESNNLFRYYGVGDGPHEVPAFEHEFAGHMGTKHALCVNAGSSAIICGLIGAGVGRGDEVIVPAYTWNATAERRARDRRSSGARRSRRVADPRSCRRRTEADPTHEGAPPVHMRGTPAAMERSSTSREPRARARRGRRARRWAPPSRDGGSAPSATPARSACSSTRSSRRAKAV